MDLQTPSTQSHPPAGSRTCIVCGDAGLLPLVNLASVPVFSNVLYPDQREARQAARADIDLVCCQRCGHIFNTSFDPAVLAYNPRYENSLHFSPHFQTYADALATDLVARYGLRNKTIVEIGSGQGDFLAALCRLGENQGIGFDPSYAPDPDRPMPHGVLLVTDYYSGQYSYLNADLIVSRHTLEHIDQPAAFLKELRRSLNPGQALFFEVPNAAFTVRDLSIWDIIYEHRSYFHRGSLAWLFQDAGFEVTRLDEPYDGQFLTVEANPVESQAPVMVENAEMTTHLADARAFPARFDEKLSRWCSLVDEMVAAGRRMVVWGAGSKGVSLLNFLQAGDRISAVVDINPRKHGMYVAGAGTPIVPPAQLPSLRPDTVLVMNPVYLDEIKASLARIGLQPELVIA